VACIYFRIAPRFYVDDIRAVSPVDQAVIDPIAGVASWRVPGFEVDTFVHELRTIDHHLSASSIAFGNNYSFLLSCRLHNICNPHHQLFIFILFYFFSKKRRATDFKVK
jgi:hypothetical protein